MSVAIYSRCQNRNALFKKSTHFRPPFDELLMNGLNGKPLGDTDAMRYSFEVDIFYF